ncbi:hypothetical protein [Clostridium muellerianum]|uniref:hypothetical protein n=1 Tax=Clostridium muellerianum TaxID=2716538 RepID=UPI001FAE2F96|nr:hypothetical protein [Clostridium muellerianum]
MYPYYEEMYPYYPMSYPYLREEDEDFSPEEDFEYGDIGFRGHHHRRRRCCFPSCGCFSSCGCSSNCGCFPFYPISCAPFSCMPNPCGWGGWGR